MTFLTNREVTLVLSVVGDSQALPAAMYAAANSGQVVGLSSSAFPAGYASFTELNPQFKHGVLDDTSHFVVVSESASLKRLLFKFRAQIAGRNVLLAPGGFAGALRVIEWFEEWSLPAPHVAEVSGFIAAGHLEGPDFRLDAVKRQLPFASITQSLTHDMLADYALYFPNLVASDLVTTSLSNTNHMIHPGVVLLNAVRIENGEPFRFYREGLSPAAADLLHAIDRERMEVANALGAESLSLCEWMLRFYGDQGMQGTNIVECLQSFPSFENTPSPPSLKYRYLADDVCFGVAQYLQLAIRLGTPTENLRAVVAATSHLYEGSTATADEESERLFQKFLNR